MNQLRLTILLGLQKSGRTKSFTQILTDADVHYTQVSLLEAAQELEALGLIQSVTYRLPLEVFAELSSYGSELLLSMQNESSRSDKFRQNWR